MSVREVVYENEWGDKTYVWEFTRKELLSMIDEVVDAYRCGVYDDDISIWIEYDDGTWFYMCGADCEGRYRKQHIHGIAMSDSGGYSVYGDYVMLDYNMILELV